MTITPQRELAVLILAYNRVDELKQTLQAVVQQGPPNIYVSVDGPKLDSEQDKAKVLAVHDAVLSLGKSHSITTRFAKINGGVLDGVLDGIDWFFSQETQGIILEDDVVVAPDSLPLASSLLDQLRPQHNIGSISLFNPVPRGKLTHQHNPVRLSALPSSQYWGTWSDRWEVTHQFRDYSLATQTQVLRAIESVPDTRLRRFWINHLANNAQGWQCWEDLWILTHWISRWSAAYTNSNLSRHIGFTPAATNSWDKPSWYPTHYDNAQSFLISHQLPEPDPSADAWYFNQRFGLSTWKRIKHSIWSRVPILREFYLSTLRTWAKGT